jgi:hypothetical protein
MFKSKIRDIVIPQSEHLKLAGAIAYIWGNEDSAKPRFNFDSFVTGVAYHDRGYGLLDNYQLGSVAEDEWLAIQSKGFNEGFSEDIVADIVAKKHIVRLLNNHDTAGSLEIANKFEQELLETITTTEHTNEDFEFADKITDFIDSIAFNFCFEQPTSSSNDIQIDPSENGVETITYKITENHDVIVSPWPFRMDSLEGHIFGYKQENYPTTLNPVLIPFRLSKQ